MKNLMIKSLEQKSTDQIKDRKVTDTKTVDNNGLLKAGFVVKYCGSITTGSEGDVKQIEKAIWQVVKSGEYPLTPVRFECLEIGIRVTRENDDNVSNSLRCEAGRLTSGASMVMFVVFSGHIQSQLHGNIVMRTYC